MLKNRHSRLDRFFEDFSLDALLVTDSNNIRYLSAFSGSEGAMLVTPTTAWFLCDSRYTSQAQAEIKGAEVLECTVPLETIGEITRQHALWRIGFEAAATTVAAWKKMAAKLPAVELVEIGAELDEIRACKDGTEIEKLRAIAALSSESLAAVLPLIKPGVREDEIALHLEFEMRRRGADGRGFDFIVASGERGAMPHGRASSKPIATGDMVTIDFGAVKEGYHSDETVTVACGKPPELARRIHEVVRSAHDLAIEAVRPGISCKELDGIARSYIREQGFGEHFGHGLGHGIGLAVHEKPTLSPRSEALLEEGMVITVEPGIYIPGFGGVRIEDTVAVTAEGCLVLTSADKRLLIL
ncbi:MAG TPA: aminopeptidase P family protein [Desulfuromonadales bacterium]|nr:aminopeptidase P family protein [Desulfuromonadales bacterium]